jgi:hypothetical protein
MEGLREGGERGRWRIYGYRLWLLLTRAFWTVQKQAQVFFEQCILDEELHHRFLSALS